MVDYKLKSDYTLDRNEWGSFKEVTGLKEFEQNVAIELKEQMTDIHGTRANLSTTKEKARLAIYRVAQEFGAIDQVENLEIERATDSSDTIEVTVTYITAEPFSETF